MKVLAVGGGGREHAAVEALYRSGSEIYSVMKNANPGIIARSAEHILCDEKDIEKVVSFAKENGVELAFIGPEAPLGVGIVDALEKAGIRCASPTQAAARIDAGIAKAQPLPAEENTLQERTMTDFHARKRWSRRTA